MPQKRSLLFRLPCFLPRRRYYYPEVTGYYIPTLMRWGFTDQAESYAKWLISIQHSDGAWYDTEGSVSPEGLFIWRTISRYTSYPVIWFSSSCGKVFWREGIAWDIKVDRRGKRDGREQENHIVWRRGVWKKGIGLFRERQGGILCG